MQSHSPLSGRRAFLGALAAAPLVVPSRVLGAQAPSKQMTIAFIGTGNNGYGWMQPFLKDSRVRVVAVCDVNREGPGYWDNTIRGREPARQLVNKTYGNEDCKAYEDYREVLARPDVDAVYIASPDHWHALHAIHAARAGKHILCQKPLTTTVAEGRAMVTAVEKAGKVWQTGSQQRSDWAFLRAKQIVDSGRIGRVHLVRVGLPGGIPDFGKTAHRHQPEPVPEGFRYDWWLGPAAQAPYCPARVGVNFRWIRDYSGGQLTDWGAHHIDCAQWILGKERTGPIAIRNAHGKWANHPLYNTATDFYFDCDYGNDLKMIVSSNERGGVRFVGLDGWVWVSRGRIEASFPLPEDTITDAQRKAKPDSTDVHCANFTDGVLKGTKTVAPIEVAHRSISIAHLGNIALAVGRDLRWDPKAETILNDSTAAAKLTRAYRAPYSLS
ncbi:MAG: Gfo/Idh/MocA family oxidoreductase [Bryobacterales bacterium]|nr:Gfo/Idh/MocA family oxidoreductase [Bryobacterales bacterium]